MTTKTTTTAAVIASATINADVAERVADAFDTFVHLASTHLGVSFPKDASDADKWEKAVTAAFRAHAGYRKARREEEVRAFRKGCEEVITSAKGEMKKAMEEYEGLSAQLKGLMPLPVWKKAKVANKPIMCEVPVSDFSDIFPQGTAVEQIGALLKKMGYDVVKISTGLAVSVRLFPAPTADERVAKTA